MKIKNSEFKETKQIYRDMFEKNNSIMLVIDTESLQIIDANSAACDFYGYSLDEITDMKISDINILDTKEIEKAMKVAISKGAGHFEFKHRLSSGEIKDVEVFSSVLVINNKTNLYSIVHDVSERKQVELENIQSKQIINQINMNFSSFFNTISDMLFVLDINGNIVKVNDTACKRLDFLELELIGQSVLVVHPENRREEAEKVVFDMLSGKTEFCPIPVITKGGIEIPVETRIVVGSWNGEPALFGVVKDISELKKSEEKFSKAFRSNPASMAISRIEDGLYIDVNDTFLETLCFNRDDIIGKKSSDLDLFADYSQRNIVKKEFEKNGKVENIEVIVKGNDGRKHNGMFSIESISIGETPCFITTMTDITRQKQMEDMLFAEKELFKTTLLSVGDGVIAIDYNGNVVVMNKVAEQLTGWSQEQAYGKAIEQVFNIINEFTRVKCESPKSKALSTGDTNKITSNNILISKEGIEIPIEDSAAPIKDENGNINGVVLVFRDFTDKKQKLKEIEYLSYHDQLTGLYNRSFYEEELIRLNEKFSKSLTLVMIDVNGLKLTNDAFGHKTGDILLQKVANILNKECREEDIVSRIGGDEFVILMPGIDAKGASKIINNIKLAISNEKFENIIISVSIGLAVKEDNMDDINEVFKKAEDDMYRHKLSESSSMRSNTINLIINSLYEKSNREMLHSKRVSELCEAIAVKMNFDYDDINHIRIAGLMHDIGKIGVDDNVLNKNGKLNSDEWYEIMRHSEIGYRILSSVNEFSEISEYVLEHHERWNGKGYPKGLKGADISIQARIIAVADSYDAMTSDRSYRKGLSEIEAVDEIRRCSGSQFDPHVVNVFLEEVLFVI